MLPTRLPRMSLRPTILAMLRFQLLIRGFDDCTLRFRGSRVVREASLERAPRVERVPRRLEGAVD